jgi:hypothetical protein
LTQPAGCNDEIRGGRGRESRAWQPEDEEVVDREKHVGMQDKVEDVVALVTSEWRPAHTGVGDEEVPEADATTATEMRRPACG